MLIMARCVPARAGARGGGMGRVRESSVLSAASFCSEPKTSLQSVYLKNE